MTWLVSPKPSTPRVFTYSSSSPQGVEGGKWLAQITPKVERTCSLLQELLEGWGVKVNRTDLKKLDICILDFTYPPLEKKAEEMLKLQLERLPPEKREWLEKNLGGCKRWSTSSSIAVTTWNDGRTVSATGEVASPFFHHPDFAKWTREEMKFGICAEKPCRIDEIHVHSCAGQSSVHVHFSCRDEDPRKVAYCVNSFVDELVLGAKDFIEETEEIAKGKE